MELKNRESQQERLGTSIGSDKAMGKVYIVPYNQDTATRLKLWKDLCAEEEALRSQLVVIEDKINLIKQALIHNARSIILD